MNYRYITALLIAAALVPLYSQDNPATEKNAPTVYQEVVLEDFETTPYTKANISFNLTSDQEADISMRNEGPATATSKKYLGVKMKTRGDDVFIIKPAKDLVIDKYCKSISFWVYGKKTKGTLSLLLMDTTQRNHVIRLATVDFLGWKKVEIPLGKQIIQADDFLNQKKILKILQLQYRTAGPKRNSARWEYLYIDDITATVRERYNDKQSDEW